MWWGRRDSDSSTNMIPSYPQISQLSGARNTKKSVNFQNSKALTTNSTCFDFFAMPLLSK